MLQRKIHSAGNKIKFVANDIGYWLGVKSISNIHKGKRILIYHGVVNQARKDINSRFISTEEFERQINYFKTHFKLVSLSEYWTTNEDESPLTLSLTFDDGYLNNLTDALPILEKYQIPASIFISTIRQVNYDYLWADLLDLYRYTGPDRFVFQGVQYTKGKHEYSGSGTTLKAILKQSDWKVKRALCDYILANNSFLDKEQYDPYCKLLNEEHIKRIAQSPLMEIGSHALYHNCLSKISLKEAEKELTLSKSYLENLIQKEVISFAYPDGSYSNNLIDLAEQTGYKYQLLVDYNEPGDRLDRRTENRFGINPHISFNNQIQCIIDGKY